MGAYISVPVWERTIAQRYGLQGQRCLSCGAVLFPPKVVCPECGGDSFESASLSGKGRIYSFTVIAGGGAPPEFEWQANAVGSYVVGLVELEEGPRIIAQIVGVDPRAATTTPIFEDSPRGSSDVNKRPLIGLPVKAVIRKVYEQEGVIRYGYKFKVVSEV